MTAKAASPTDAAQKNRPKGNWLAPEIQRLTARGLTFRVTQWHKGAGGVPLLFLNGLGANAEMAAPLLRRIPDRTVWTLDMPGTGGSPDCFWPYSAQSMASAVMDVALQLGHDRLDVAGFSWGGALAQQLAAQFPDHVERLILLGTTGHFSAADIGWGAIFDQDVVSGTMGSMKMPVSSALGLTYQSLAMAGWSNDRLVPHLIGHPILILSGARDQVVPPCYSDELAKTLQADDHISIAGGHFFPFAKADATAAEIRAFLERGAPARKQPKRGGISAPEKTLA